MKKVLLVAGVVLVAFSSCVKDRTCTCKDSSGTVIDTFTIHSTKKAATTLCTADGSYGETCTLN